MATIAVSGALRLPDTPAWVSHDTDLTEDQALDAIIGHMAMDALDPDQMDDTTGPVYWNGEQWAASGNFAVSSACFRAAPLSDAGRARLLNAWAEHKTSRQYGLALQIAALYRRCDAQVRAAERGAESHRVHQQVQSIRMQYSRAWRPYEAELLAIYHASRMAMAER